MTGLPGRGIRLTNADYRRMPWRNGGGTTTELVVEPPDGARFLYRVSIADVTADGPFSRFAGYDRHIVLVEGEGMTLEAGAHGRHELRALAPYAFSGDWDVTGSLRGGPVRDFNLMVDRSRASGRIAVVQLAADEAHVLQLGTDEVCIVHVIAGALTSAARGDTLVARHTAELGAAEPTTLVVARVGAVAS